MAKHRYWRAVGLKPHDGGSIVELSEFWLLNGNVRADSGAALTSSVAPVSGLLTNLQDGNPATMATLVAGSTLTWDLGTATEITNIQVGAGDSAARFLLGCAIERSDDGVTWREFQLNRNWMGIRWPGARALTANVMRIPPISHLTVRMSFEPTAWQKNEFGPAITFLSEGATINSSGLIKGSRALQITGGRVYQFAAGGQTGVLAYPAGIDFTIQAWVRVTDITTNASGIIGAFGDLNQLSYPSYLQLNPSTKQLTGSVTGIPTGRSLTAMVDVTWLNTNHHVAFSSENGTYRLFVDGVKVAEQAGANLVPGRGNPDVQIGDKFPGLLDNVGIDYKALYFSDFTPPDNIVPQPEWLIDAVTASPTFNAPTAIPSAASIAHPFGQTKLHQARRGRRDYLTGVLGDGVGRVRGFTLDYVNPLNKPYACRVRLVRETDGLVVCEQWSKSDGSYDFQYVDELQSYTVLAYYEAHGKRAVVADGLTLANGKVELMA